MGGVKNGIGNREFIELICTTHGHELRGGMWVREGVLGRGGVRGRNWENGNSIINQIYLKIR